MGQIVFNGQKPKYCNLVAITTGSKKDYVIPAGEVWLIDSTNASKTDGTGKYDYYIIGDGSKTASQLAEDKARIDDNDEIVIDNTPTSDSTHAVSSGGVYQAIQAIDVTEQISGKADKSEMSVVAGTGANADKTTITLKSGTSATVLTTHQDISGKQDVLTFDSVPTASSANPVTSGGVKSALDGKADAITTYTKSEVNNLIVPANTEISVVSELPASGSANTIYRVSGTTSYNDYGWDGTQFVKLAEYDNLIDDEINVSSNNLIKNSGVAQMLIDQITTKYEGLNMSDVYEYTSNTKLQIGTPASDGTVTVTSASSTTYRVLIYNNIPKGTIIHFTGTATTSRSQVFGCTATNPYNLETLVGLELNHAVKYTLSGSHDYYYIMPYDGYLFVYYYNQNWSNRAWTVWENHRIVIDDNPQSGSKNSVSSGGVYFSLKKQEVEINGGELNLTPIYIVSGKEVYNGGVAGTGTGYYYSQSGYNLYIFDVSEFVGKNIGMFGTFHTTGYKSIFCKNYSTLPASATEYDNDSTLWTANMVSAITGRGGTSGNDYTDVLTIPNGAVYLILQGNSSKTPTAAVVYSNVIGGIKDDIEDLSETVSSINAVLNGENALAETKSGYILRGQKNSGTAYWNADSNYNAYIFDVTAFAGDGVSVRFSKHNGCTQYKLVSDYSIIGTSSTSITSVLLGEGANTSTPSTASYSLISIDLSTTAITDQASVGKVYLIVNLHKNFDHTELYATEGLIVKLNKDYEWVADEKTRILDCIQPHFGKEAFIVGFNTDQHIRQSIRDRYTDPVLRGLKALRDIAEKVPFSVICLGGDAAGYGYENTQALVDADVLDVCNAVDTDACPVVFITGNHDAGQNLNPQWSGADGYSMFNTTIKKNVVKRQLDGFNNRSTNCWFDDNANKVRFIFLDVYARAEGANDTAAKTYSAMSAILNEALEDNKLYNSEWDVMIFSHNTFGNNVSGNSADQYPDTYWTNIVLPKINDGLSVIACVNGHSHRDGQGVKDGHLFICSQQAGIQESNQSFDGITYSKTLNSAKETSFDVFVIEKTNKKIYTYKYGAGMDRLFYYGDNARIALCNLSGIVTSNGSPVSGTITATHHNTVYSMELASDGSYNFPYLCPECEWVLSINDYEEVYTAVEGNIEKNIEIQ